MSPRAVVRASRRRFAAQAAVRDYHAAAERLVAEYEHTAARVVRLLLEIPLVRTRREDAIRLLEYMPPLTREGRRRQVARDIWDMRRRYGSATARHRLRALARLPL